MRAKRYAAAGFRLFLFSAVALYAEVVLIRWMAAEIRMFAYLKNFALLGAFLGLGLGMMKGEDGFRRQRAPWLLIALVLILVFSPQLHLTRLFFPDPGIYQWGGSLLSPSLVAAVRATPGLGTIFRHVPDVLVPWLLGAAALLVGIALLGLVVAIFFEFGCWIGALLATVNPPLTAYTLNLVGSLAGTLFYAVLVFFALPPWVWVIPIFACLWYVSANRHRDVWIFAAAIGLCLFAGWNSRVHWSPYYRIDLRPLGATSYTLSVDYDFHQDMLDLSANGREKNSTLSDAQRYYDFPFGIVPACRRALVVGAGSGNDVAAALRAGCSQVDAVEIDPTIAKLGQALHPERPYKSTSVRRIINDGRAYFHQVRGAGEKYDLIVFGLVDSQTALSVMSSLRLEFFLYSVESFQEALSLLDPRRGVLVVGFSVGWKDWVAQRIANSLQLASGQTPLIVKTADYVGALSYVVGPGLEFARSRVEGNRQVQDRTLQYTHTDIRPVRDDWPFLYYNPRRLPVVYLCSLLLLLSGGALLVRRVLKKANRGLPAPLDWPMFFMGSAFVLVETKNLSQLSILFGSTWITNAVVFSSIFVMAILANLVVGRTAVASLPTLYGFLGGALVLSYLVPFSALTVFPPVLRAMLGGGITALPVLFSSLIFAKLFEKTRRADIALGSNVLGGLFGGATEALTIFTGIKAMALIAILVYAVSGLSYLMQTRERPATVVA